MNPALSLRFMVFFLTLALLPIPAMAADGDPPDVDDYRVTAPKATPPDRDGKRNEVFLAGGMHLAQNSTVTGGGFYRFRFDDVFSVRGGFETAQASVTAGSTTVPFNINKFSAAILTNEVFYGGIGATHLQLTSQSSLIPFTQSSTVFETIAGLRLNLIYLVFGLEYRWGIGGPSTASLYSGYRF